MLLQRCLINSTHELSSLTTLGVRGFLWFRKLRSLEGEKKLTSGTQGSLLQDIK